MQNKLVYRHRRMDNYDIFYVGIGNIARAKSKGGRSAWWHKVVNKAGYCVEIVASELTWDDACELEQLLISEYGRRDRNKGSLVNMTDGGDGTLGHKLSEAHKEAIRQYGKNRSAEQNQKISERLKNRQVSEETKMKISKANTGKVRTAEQKEKWRILSLGNTYSLGYRHTPESKLKMSQSRRGIPKSAEHNHRVSVAKMKSIIDLQTGIFYYGIKDACECFNLNYDNLAAKLNGKLKNNTSLKYA